MIVRVVSYTLGDVAMDVIPPDDTLHCDRLDFIILAPEPLAGRNWHFLIHKGPYGPILDYGHRKNDLIEVAMTELSLSNSEIVEMIERGGIFDTVILPNAVLKRPNQALQPTATAVTPRADARVAPAAAVAEH